VRWVVCTLLVACESGSAKPDPTEPRPLLTDGGVASVDPPGKAVYTKYCVQCHGKDLKGYVADHAPSLINQTFLESATDSYLQRSIALGRPGTSMPAYAKSVGGPLEDGAITQLVDYIRAQGPRAMPLAATARGEPARGAALYNEYCKSCHGDATTRGEAMHLANVQFQQLATDSFIRYAIEKGRPGTKMLAFGTVLKPAQLDDVVAYVRALGTGAVTVQNLPAPTGKEPLFVNPTGKSPTWKIRDVKFVSVDEVARELAANKKMVIIDARPPSDWMRVHIAGAVSIPYHDMKRLDEIPKDATVVAYCACPHHLSGIVIDELIKRGYKRAYILDEGINAWHIKKYPVTAAPGVVPGAVEQPHTHP
jgi:cytochrome c oxidase cbb3-type subunit III